jgi:shikimate kinase
MGSGKSSVGKRLASRMDMEFIDMDRMIEDFAKATIEDIFDKSGEETFRSLENHILLKLLQEGPKVIATGGGTVCHSDNMEAILDQGYAVYIQLPARKLSKRVSQSNENRPLIRERVGKDLTTFISNHLKEREVFYKQAHMVIDGDKVNSQLLGDIKENYLDWSDNQTR